ncbi:MAG TPA: tetratricopeptide repeat protein [Mucilaginibacter sp.]|jgi:tetratricopeptide (TPR) repeat protein|nr:tetratricopeptide repeat protein [Mucilaginibacter sp.]
MDHNEETTEKLIRYLDGELSGAELTAIERLLDIDKDVRKEFEGLELAREAVRAYGLKNQVASVRKEMLESTATETNAEPKVYPFFRNAMKYAAVLVFAVLSITIYMYATVSSSKLYQDNYQAYQGSVTRGDASTGTIAAAFNAAKYRDVITTFKRTASHTNRDYFLAAQAYAAIRRYDDAIDLYNKLISLPGTENSFHDDSEYYLGLTYLENQEPAKAKLIFQKIYSNPDHLYHDKVSFWMMLKLKMLTIKDSGK